MNGPVVLTGSADNNWVEESKMSGQHASDEKDHTPMQNSPSPPDDRPPDGGLRAWLQVLGAFMLFLNTWYVSFLKARSPMQPLTFSQKGNHKLIRSVPNIL